MPRPHHLEAVRRMEGPFLTHEEEVDCIRRWQATGDRKAIDKLVRANMRLVASVARRFLNWPVDQEDLISEGVLGVMEAANRMDLSRGVRFVTVARLWIRASMQAHILQMAGQVRMATSSEHKAMFFGIRRIVAQCSTDPAMTPERLCRAVSEAFKVTPEAAELALSRLKGDLSMDAPVADDDSASFAEYVADGRPLQDEIVGGAIDAKRRDDMLRAGLATLDDRERAIVLRRSADEPEALVKIGADFGISKERVRQIESKALGKLKVRIGRKALEFTS